MATRQYALDVQPVNVNAALEQYDRGAQTAQNARQDQRLQQQDAANAAMKQYAPGIIAGNKDAFAAGVQVDPTAAMKMLQSARQMNEDEINHNAKQDAARLNVFQNLLDIHKNHPDQYDAAVSQAKPLLMSYGVPAENISDMSPGTLGSRVGILQNRTEVLKQALAEKHADRDYNLDVQRLDETKRSNRASETAASAANGGFGKPPVGFRWAPDGSLVGIKGGPGDETLKPLTEVQGNSLGFANRMVNVNPTLADKNFSKALESWAERMATDYIPFGLGNSLTTPEFQRADRAARDFVNAQLRKESGAAIGNPEFVNAYKQYIPAKGDSDQVIKDKTRARAIAMRNMFLQAGPASRSSAQAVEIPEEPGEQDLHIDEADAIVGIKR